MTNPVDFNCVLADLYRRRDGIAAMILAPEAFLNLEQTPIVLAAGTPGGQSSAKRGVNLERRSKRTSKPRHAVRTLQARKNVPVAPGSRRARAVEFEAAVLVALKKPATPAQLAARLHCSIQHVWEVLQRLLQTKQVTRSGRLYVRSLTKPARLVITPPAADVVWSGKKDDPALTGDLARRERP